MAKYRQGKFSPKNIKKYDGDPTTVIYRSSWERIVFSYLDSKDECVKWSSEETIIPYRSPIDNQIHRYFVDIKATFKGPDGKMKTYLIEIKPDAQTRPPQNIRNKAALYEATATYAVNTSKWTAAKEYCKKMGYEFIFMTEYDIGIKKRPQ